MRERRNYTRYNIEGKAIIKDDQANSILADGSLINISYGGFSINTQTPLEIEKPVSFELTTDLATSPLKGKGRVKNVSNTPWHGISYFRVGIEFVDVDRIDVLGLMDLAHKHLLSRKTHPQKKQDFLGPY